MKPKRRWAWNVARTGERRGEDKFWCGKQKERDHMDDLRVNGNIIT